MEPVGAAVVTVSDRGFAGEREDVSGPLVARMLREMGAQVLVQTVVPDELEEIKGTLLRLAHDPELELVITTGGTGPAPRDVTPEATEAVIERRLPGVAEILRLEGYRKTPLAVISRGVAGIRGNTLIINLPGSPRAVREGMQVLAPILPHTIKMLRGRDTEHPTEGGSEAANG